MHPILICAVKLAVSAGLIGFALSRIDTRGAFALLHTLSPGIVMAAVLLLVLQHLIACARFHYLLQRLHTPIPFSAATINVFEGLFFSQVFISFIGGDAMRLWRLTQAGLPASRAFQSVLIDRVLGFVALILLIVLGIPLLFGIMPDPVLRAGVISTVCLGLLATLAFLLMHRLPLAWQRWRMFRIASDLSRLALSISGQTASLSYLLATSLLVQAANVLIIYFIAQGLGITVAFLDLLVLVPPVMLLAILPISFAGWGVREGSMAVALALSGVSAEQSVALSICFGLALFASSLPGGVFWLIDRRSLAQTK